MTLTDPALPPLIVAVVVGALAGASFERWLIWRRLTSSPWLYRRLLWCGTRERDARRQAAELAAAAVIIRLRHPWLIALWMLRAHRQVWALLVLVALLGGGAVALLAP